jgi:hypothetical protein
MSAVRALAPALVVAASLALSAGREHPNVGKTTEAPATHPMDNIRIAQIESTFHVEVGESTLVVIGDAHVH